MSKERQSNIELLRAIAMFLVLWVHADFYSIGEPSYSDVLSKPLDSSLKIIFEAICISAVNIFVMISGWFGIHAKVKGLCAFLFQCLFFTIGLFIVNIICGYTTLSGQGLLGCVMMTSSNWFIKSYLFLYILSPMLNVFVETALRVVFKKVLIAYFTMLIVCGWLFPESVTYISLGYSPLSFIGLYLLARYVNLYRPKFSNYVASMDICVVISAIVCVSAVCILLPLMGWEWAYPYAINRCFSYVSPLNIIIALYSIIMFSKFHFKSKLINWCAASCFAVFLFHSNAKFFGYSYQEMCQQLYATYSTLEYWGIMFCVMIGIYVVAIFIDKIRIMMWNIIYEYRKLKK